MGNFLAILSVVVALAVAGLVIYIAYEITSRKNLPDAPDEDDGED